MPIYAYRCSNCGHSHDQLQKLNDPAPACPQCNTPQMVKQITAAGFQLKGSGYYVTDFKGTGAAPSSAEPSSTPATSATPTSPATPAPASTNSTPSV